MKQNYCFIFMLFVLLVQITFSQEIDGMTFTMVPHVAAMEEGKLKGIVNGITPTTKMHQEFLNNYNNYLEFVKNADKKDVEGVAGTIKEVNVFLVKHGLKPLNIPNNWPAYGGIINLLVKWKTIGEETRIELPNKKEVNGVSMKKSIQIFYNKKFDRNIARVETKRDDINVFIMEAPKVPKNEYELFLMSQSALQFQEIEYMNAYLTFPMVDMTTVNKKHWFKNINIETKKETQKMGVAVQISSLKVNHMGFLSKTLFYSHTLRGHSTSASVHVDEPFLFIITLNKNGQNLILVSHYIGEKFFKNPGDFFSPQAAFEMPNLNDDNVKYGVVKKNDPAVEKIIKENYEKFTRYDFDDDSSYDGSKDVPYAKKLLSEKLMQSREIIIDDTLVGYEVTVSPKHPKSSFAINLDGKIIINYKELLSHRNYKLFKMLLGISDETQNGLVIFRNKSGDEISTFRACLMLASLAYTTYEFDGDYDKSFDAAKENKFFCKSYNSDLIEFGYKEKKYFTFEELKKKGISKKNNSKIIFFMGGSFLLLIGCLFIYKKKRS